MNEIRKKLERITQFTCGCGVGPEPLCTCWDSVGALRLRVQGMKELADEALALLPPAPEPHANLISNRKLGQLLELIDKLCRLGNGEHDGNSIGNKIAQEARTILLSAEPAPSSEKALRARCEALAASWDATMGREDFAPSFAEELREILASSPAPDDILMSAVTGPISYPEPAPEAPKEEQFSECYGCKRDGLQRRVGLCQECGRNKPTDYYERSATT